MKYIFVYGTLKGGTGLLKNSPFIGTVHTEELFCLYKVTGSFEFPAMVPSETGKQIKGELYEVSDETIKALDKYECAPELFKRESIDIANSGNVNFIELPVETYIYQETLKGFEKLDSSTYTV